VVFAHPLARRLPGENPASDRFTPRAYEKRFLGRGIGLAVIGVIAIVVGVALG
jgi:hypothetical protein